MTTLRHVGIPVESIEESLQFYRDYLGFKVVFHEKHAPGDFIDKLSDIVNVHVEIVKMVGPDGSMIELLKYHSHNGTDFFRQLCNIGAAHIAFTVKDLWGLHDKLWNIGINFLGPIQTSPDGKVRVVFCQAPEGTYIELVEELVPYD